MTEYDLPAGVTRADPAAVDKESVIAIGECQNCGPNALTTVKVENAEYIASCSSCDHDMRAPVVINEDGDELVAFNAPVVQEEIDA